QPRSQQNVSIYTTMILWRDCTQKRTGRVQLPRTHNGCSRRMRSGISKRSCSHKQFIERIVTLTVGSEFQKKMWKCGKATATDARASVLSAQHTDCSV